jgi:fatty-acid desaturase
MRGSPPANESITEPFCVSPKTDACNDERFVKRDGMNWVSVIAFTAFHIGAVAAFFFFTWPAFLTALALYWVSLSFGIGMGYHRLLTHRSYKAPKWIEYSLAVCGTLALEGGPIFWVAVHRAPQVRGQTWRSTHAKGRQVVGAHRLDAGWRCGSL